MFNFLNNQNTTNKDQQNNIEKTNENATFGTLQKARQDLMGEIQAVIEYDNHIHSSTNRLAIETWKDIKQEELVHIGELFALINYLDPNSQIFIQKGIDEFNERLNKN